MNAPVSRRTWLAGSLASAALARAQYQPANVNDEIRQLADRALLSMRFNGSTAQECRRWQGEFATKLQDLLGLAGVPFSVRHHWILTIFGGSRAAGFARAFAPPPQWETSLEETVDFDDHRRESLVLRAEGVRPLPVYLLTPKPVVEQKHPGILALHGHGKWGNDPVVGIARTPEAQTELERARYDYGLQLVRQGYVVVAPCFTPFGRRLDDETAYGGEDPCAVTFIRMLALGRLLIAENLRDALWSFELLSRHAMVDPKRVGCVGLSYGGRMTMLTTALEPRIRVAVISGALNLMQERIEGRYGCGAQIIPGLLKFGDVPEISSLIAPRPCLWEVGREDPLMVKDRIGIALERIRRAYQAFSVKDALHVDFFEGDHRWNGVKAYPLLASCLDLHSLS
jgi:dienelactone hydrolase